MRIIKISLLLFCISVLFSCGRNLKHTEINKLEFRHVKDFVLPVKDSTKTAIYGLSYHETGTLSTLWLNVHSGKILGYNLKTEKQTAEIPLKGNSLMGFNYKSKDSIFVFLNASSNLGYSHDSILFRLNDKGEILQYYSFEQMPVFCGDKKNNKQEQYYSYLNFQNLKVENDKIFLLFRKFIHTENENPGGYINMSSGNFQRCEELHYPNIKKNKYYPSNYNNIQVELSRNGNPLYAFPYTSEILEYDLQTKTVISHKMKSILADTVVASDTEVRSERKFNQPRFSFFHYDKNNNRYMRFVKQPEKQYGKYFHTVILSDKNFNTIAEGIVPSAVSPSKLFFAGNKLIAYNYKKTIASPGKLVFSVYEIKVKESSEKELTAELKKHEIKEKKVGTYTHFLKKYNKSGYQTYAAVAVPYSLSCPSCVTFTFMFFEKNKEAISNRGVFMLVSGKDKRKIIAELKKRGISPDGNLIFYDEKEEYIIYHQKKFDIINPRLTIVKNGKIIHDKVYTPKTILDLQRDVRDFLEKENPKNKNLY